MSSAEFGEWLAVRTLDPAPADRLELMLAQLLALHANLNRAKDQKPYAPADFLPDYLAGGQSEDEREEQDQDARRTQYERNLAMVEALNAAFGGKDVRQAQTPSISPPAASG